MEFHPVQTTDRKGGLINKAVTLRTYEVYCVVYSEQEAMVTGGCRETQMVRAKFMLQEITESGYSYTDKDGKRIVNRNTSKKLVFVPQYDQSIPEDKRFAQATPSGRFEMTVDNPAALAQFEIGQQYYVDFTPAG